MSLVKVTGDGQITLSAEMREALRVKEGDLLEAEVVGGQVWLRPVAAAADRQAAWRKVREVQASVRYLGPEPRPSPEEEEQEVFAIVEDFRDRRG